MHISRIIAQSTFLYDLLSKTWYFMVFCAFSQNPNFRISQNLQIM